MTHTGLGLVSRISCGIIPLGTPPGLSKAQRQFYVMVTNVQQAYLGRLWTAIDSDDDEFVRLHKRRTLAEILGVGERFVSLPKRKNQ